MANLHEGQRILTAGSALAEARGAVIMIHGRGATASDILSLSAEFKQPDLAYLAPQAANNTWYPYRFLEPLERNEPWLTWAMEIVGSIFTQVEQAGMSADKTVLLGFSQGACLSLEYAARNAKRYGGVVGYSGGVIGPEGTPRNYLGSLADTPVFIGCSDVDFHIPVERVHESADVMKKLGGAVTERIYPGMDHTINMDEIEFVRGMLKAL